MAKKKKSGGGQQATATANANATTDTRPASANEKIPAQPTPPRSTTSTPTAAPNPWFSSKPKNGEPSTSALIICRNKHWRYISSFHGPWLQLPPEVLESLAHTNYLAPRPHPIDPAVFYDLVKIRKAVDEATNIAVRAASGVTSASLNASLSANNGMLNGAGAAALGLGFGGTGGGAKLSRERKHRMRELATQKLSQAYHLDEIAASVATMQSASTLEDLALHVLGRNALDYDARYVHFFHEKIPSRMMAEYTPLDPLNSLLSERPSDGSAFRTRALTRIFKEDYAAAARDLTEGLAVARWLASQHRQGRDQLVLASEAAKQRAGGTGRDWRNEVQIPEEDQPSSLEVQMLFHRGNVHLALACQHVHDALDAYWDEVEARDSGKENGVSADPSTGNGGGESEATTTTTADEALPKSPAERMAHKRHLEYRRMVKSNARKALKDYLEFLKHFDYTPGIPAELAEEFIRRINAAAASQAEAKKGAKSVNGTKSTTTKARVDADFDEPLDAQSGALIPAARKTSPPPPSDLPAGLWPPPTQIYPASHLFAEKIPSAIPPYPNPSTSLTHRSNPTIRPTDAAAAAAASLADSNESVTYHPLLTDALHSLLLCHALLQTSPTELKRHAHNAARLARICDGYPIFLAARSPARADWVEVLRRAANWVGLTQSWEALCRPAPLPGQGTQGLGDRGWNLGREPETPARGGNRDATAGAVQRSTPSTSSTSSSSSSSSSSTVDKPTPPTSTSASSAEDVDKGRRERRKHEAILEALADERVVDEESFQRAVRARERRAEEDEEMAEAAAAREVASLTEAESAIRAIEDVPTPQPASPPAKPAANGRKTPATNGHANGASNGTQPPAQPQQKRWAQDEGKDYPISTERAEAISRWVREAPLTVEGASKGKKGGKKKSAASKKSGGGAASASGLEESVGRLGVGAGGEEEEEEEVDE